MSASIVGRNSFESPSLADQVAAVKASFAAPFGPPPQWIAAAPGRVHLIDEHTDYDAGFVLPLAIERYVVMAAARPLTVAAADRVRVHSTLLDHTDEFTLADLNPDRRDWTSYVRGTFAGCIDRGM